MKLSDLADLVVVRNHINTVINDKSITSRDDFRPLNNARSKLDQKFVEGIKALDFDNLFYVNIVKHQQAQYLEGLGGFGIVLPSPEGPRTSGYLNIQSDGSVSISSKDGITIKSPGIEMAQLSFPLNFTTTSVVGDGVWEDPENAQRNETEVDVKVSEAEEDPEAAEMALIAERVKAQKELLKKEGRSNKRVSKVKEDVTDK